MKRQKKECSSMREHLVIKQILKEINIVDKINWQWKDGLITEFQFSKTLDRLLINIKKYQIELKQSAFKDLKKKLWGEENEKKN